MDGQKTAWAYIKGYKFRSLLVKNFIYVFMLVTIPLLLVLSLNHRTLNTVVNNRVMDMNEKLLQKNAVVTDNAMVGILDILNRLVTQDFIYEIVQAEDLDMDYYADATQAMAKIKEQTQSNSLIVSAYIYSDINEMLISNNGVQSIRDAQGVGKWYDIYKQIPMRSPCVLVNHANSIFVCQPIWIRGGEQAGLLVLDVDLQKIRDLLETQEVARQGVFFVMDINDQIMYCNEQDTASWDETIRHAFADDIAGVKPGQTIILGDNERRIVSVADSVHKSWKYALVTEMPEYKAETAVISDFLFTSVLVGIVASILAAYIITYLTYRPMKKIMSVIENPQLHWSEAEATKQSNELLYITSNILADRSANQEIAEELEERIRALRQAQFRALQFQIDPHFLYNTLETIKWSAVEEMGLGNKVSKMLTKVARLYRLGLENDDVIVSLKEELDFLKLYIEILRIRFGDSIRFHWNIAEDLYDCSVIKMCLQPIVENAIQHGLRPKNYRGNITVSANYENECLYISVENDGQYISPAELAKLNEKLQTGTGFEESRVGLRNVNERIKLIYGKKYGVSLSCLQPDCQNPSEEGGGVRVELSFPCRNFNRSEEKK